jgi:uncharacterized membrane protein YeaQ/YmgE (transglycosylase-associated protein family)
VDVIGFLLGGLIIGLLARLLVPGRQPLGCLLTMLAGLAGSLVAGLVGRELAGDQYQPGFVASVLGAAVVVYFVARALGRHDR